ncbi:pentatricopeptide repeat-containing protein At4g13650-like [Cynara cardunculus var. scolymus]|uniref:pentatricopeptide repeat-containing protein At4g13650-like n=1 Tax=Cynara cardunculus var. scolymus TaxID=59895 RepID=UPI000D629243|nr:pentatricopeptide repeat-containing protein At4g13650-like [Cynara cardunculus var. scolymus]
MQIVLKHQIRSTHCLFSRVLSTLLNPHSFLDINFSLSNVSIIDNPKENQLNANAFDLLVQLQHGSHGSVGSSYVLNRLVSSCANSRSLLLGIQIHSFVFRMGFCSHVYINTALVDMYCKCGKISGAHKLFDEMPQRNVITWNSLLSGYLHTHHVDLLVDLFTGMLRLGIYPTHSTVATVLVGCSQLDALELGEQVHGLGTKSGFLSNVVVGTALLEMYWKCSDVDDSRKIFDNMPDKNAVSWTSMITGYAQNQQADKAMYMIREMLSMGHKAESVTYNYLLSSFCNPEDMVHCEQIHCRVIREGLESDLHLAVTLVTVYSQCGSNFEDFYKICSTVPIKNQISCNAIVAGFSNLGSGEKALSCFSEMRQAGIDIDFFTVASILKVTGVIAGLEEGSQVHALIIKSAYDSNIYIQNGLISMYARCGKIHEAKGMFSSMVEHDTISWNSLLSGYAQHGYGREAVEAFEQMTKTMVKPDLTTYLIMLSACSHVGWLDKGIKYFGLMRNDSSLEPPKLEHYGCIVDLYARAGYLFEAETFFNSMPIEAGPSIYKALLSACRVHGNKEIALRISRKFVDRFPDDPATYVQLSNILATNGYWDDSAGAHDLMIGRGIKKKAGCSWI